MSDCTATSGLDVELFKIHPERNSHSDFFASREWNAIDKFWGRHMVADFLPPFITESAFPAYGVTNLDAIHETGLAQFSSSDARFRRKTFAIRIGYLGSKYEVIHLPE